MPATSRDIIFVTLEDEIDVVLVIANPGLAPPSRNCNVVVECRTAVSSQAEATNR